jgi:hypothetical protein
LASSNTNVIVVGDVVTLIAKRTSGEKEPHRRVVGKLLLLQIEEARSEFGILSDGFCEVEGD